MKQNSYRQDPLLSRFDSTTSTFQRDPDDPRDFAVSSLQVRNFDRTSKVFHRPDDFDLFDNRSDLPLLFKQEGIAVAIELANLNAIDPTPRGVMAAFRVVLTDENVGFTVHTSSIQRVRMNAKTMGRKLRVDIPLTYFETHSTHDYLVSVVSAKTDRVICSRKVRFYDLPVLQKLPTRWFTATEACVLFEKDEAYRGIFTGHQLKIRFSINSDIQPILSHLPELSVRVYLPEDRIIEQFILPQALEGIDEELTVLFEEKIEEIPEKGYLYAELRSMGYPFTGLILPIADLEYGYNRIKTDWLIIVDNPGSQTVLDHKYRALRRALTTSFDDFTEYELETRHDFLEEKNHIVDPFVGEITALDRPNEFSFDHPDEVAEDDDVELFDTPEEKSDEAIQAMSQLNRMVGLSSLKEMVRRQTELHSFLAMRRKAGMPNSTMPLHALFLGNPGTGKTTVGKLLGQLLKEAGALSSGHVVYKERSTLIGQYYSSEGENVRQAIEDAKGGILFIDEAYQLFQPEDPRDPGKFVIESLMTALADPENRDWMLVLAGYSKPLLEMIKMNPGLASRIPSSNYYWFEDLDSDDLMEVATRYCDDHHYQLSRGATAKLAMRIERDWRHRDESFGNARHVINLLETEVIPAMAQRVMAVVNTPIELPVGFPAGFTLPKSTIVNNSLLQMIEPEDIR